MPNLSGIHTVVLNGIARAYHLSPLQARDRTEHGFLDINRHTRGHAVHVHFVSIKPLWFQKDLVARPLGGVLSARGTLGPRTVILTTLAGTIGALVLLAWPGRPVAAAIAALVVAGVMTTLSYPASIALVGRVQPQAAGAALGVIATVSPAAVVVGAPLTGALLSLTGDFTVPFLALAALPLAALVWRFALPRG